MDLKVLDESLGKMFAYGPSRLANGKAKKSRTMPVVGPDKVVHQGPQRIRKKEEKRDKTRRLAYTRRRVLVQFCLNKVSAANTTNLNLMRGGSGGVTSPIDLSTLCAG